MLEKLVEKTNIKDFFIILISSIALISVWRGVWGLFDEYLFPANPDLSYGSSIVLGLVILLSISLYRKDRIKKVGQALAGKK